MFEMVLDNKDGKLWDISGVVSDLSWKTSRIGKPSSCEFSIVLGDDRAEPEFQCHPGDIVRLKKEGTGLFYGYVFSIDRGQENILKILAYDQIRYLLTNETYVFTGMTASQIIQKIAKASKLKVGTIADTEYPIPSMIEDNVKLLDMICKALDHTLIAKLQNYVFYDDFGSLTLQNIANMSLDFVIGDESLLYDYDFKRTIDSDTYNRIKIVQDNKQTGRRDVHIAQDSANIAQWGRLQYFEKADENMNLAQIREKLNQMLILKNREQKTLKLDSIGDTRVRAGNFIPVSIKKLGINQYFLVDECSHQFNGRDHTMSLNVRVIA